MSDILEIDSVRLNYGAKIILSDIYLKCCTGEVLALLGRNGSGKSSLLQIMFGTHKLKDYSIRMNNSSIKPAFQDPIGVHYLPQFNFLPEQISVQKAFDYFDVPIEVFVKEMPDFKNREKEKIGNLSGGQKRLVEVFLILSAKGKFVLLDEPFSHIMPLHIEHIHKWILKAKLRKGIIISDHLYEQVLPLCERIYLLKDGKTHLCKERADLVTKGYLVG